MNIIRLTADVRHMFLLWSYALCFYWSVWQCNI